MNHSLLHKLATEQGRRRLVLAALDFTRDTVLAPAAYERQLLSSQAKVLW